MFLGTKKGLVGNVMSKFRKIAGLIIGSKRDESKQDDFPKNLPKGILSAADMKLDEVRGIDHQLQLTTINTHTHTHTHTAHTFSPQKW